MKFFSSTKIRRLAYTIGRIVLGAVFVYASWDKILDPSSFARIIANYQIVSSGIGDLSALFLPWLELVCGICLIINCWPRASAIIITGMLIVFMAALSYNIYRGMDIHCGCFTLTENAPSSMWFDLVRDALFLSLAVGIGLHRSPEEQKPSNSV